MKDAGYEFNAQFYKLGDISPSHSSTISYTDLHSEFDMPGLEPSTTYKVVFSATKYSEITPPSETNDDILVNNTSMNIGDFTMIGFGNEPPVVLSDISDISIIEDRKEMFIYHFRTSKYNSLEDKINSYSINGVSVYNMPTGLNSITVDLIHPINADFSKAKDVVLQIQGGEPFDTFEIFGHPYINTPFTRELISFFYVGSTGWYEYDGLTYTPLIDPMDPNQNQIDPRANMQDFRFSAEVSGNLTDFSIGWDGIESPLSDSEISPASPSNESSSSGGFGNLFGNNSNNITFNSDFELTYKGDLRAKEFYVSSDPIYYTQQLHYEMLNGFYNFRIITRDADGVDPWEARYVKNFEPLYITMPINFIPFTPFIPFGP